MFYIKKTKIIILNCPKCNKNFKISKADLSFKLICPNCKQELELKEITKNLIHDLQKTL